MKHPHNLIISPNSDWTELWHLVPDILLPSRSNPTEISLQSSRHNMITMDTIARKEG